jgi:FMN-dependent NADH-azoreductase
MRQILVIHSSPNLTSSVTRQITGEFIKTLAARHPGAAIVTRDLAERPVPHIDEAAIAALRARGGTLAPAAEAALARSDALIAELEAADFIVIGAPMYNFGIPSVLKAWIDHVARAGRTFSYGPDGPKGLLGGKPVLVLSARGGIYSEGPAKAMDFQESYLRAVLGFIGLGTDFIHVEGIGLGPDALAAGLTKAREAFAQVDPIAA